MFVGNEYPSRSSHSPLGSITSGRTAEGTNDWGAWSSSPTSLKYRHIRVDGKAIAACYREKRARGDVRNPWFVAVYDALVGI